MRTNQFGYLPNLLNLDVEYCKVRRVPALAFSGLSGLRDLEVTTHNSDWSAMVLELEPGLVTNTISEFKKIIDLPEGQINMPSSRHGRDSISFLLSTQPVSLLDP